MGERPISEAFGLIGQLGVAVGLPKELGIWTHTVDDHWKIAVNRTGGELAYQPEGKHASINIPAFNAYIEFNGWPAGLIDPFDGIIAAGSEDAFCEALKAATVTHQILSDIRAGFPRRVVAKSYAMGILVMAEGETTEPDWPTINKAILERWSLSGLEFIKKLAWDIAKGKKPA